MGILILRALERRSICLISGQILSHFASVFAWAAVILAASEVVAMGGRAANYGLQRIGDAVQISVTQGQSDPALFSIEIDVGEIHVEGVLPLAQPRVSELVRASAHRRLTLAAVFELAQSIESAHRESGYALTRIEVLPQLLRPGGAVLMRMIDVRLQDVDTTALPAEMARRIKTLVEPMLDRPMLTSAELAATIGRAQFEFGRELAFETADGREESLARLVVHGPVYSIVSEFAANSFLSRPFRSVLIGAGASAYSIANQGERLSIGGFWSEEHDSPSSFGPLWGWNGSLQLPLQSRGTSYLTGAFAAGGIRLDTPGQSISSYSFFRAGLRYVTPIFFSQNESWLIQVGPDFISEHEKYTYFFDNGPASLSIPYQTELFRGSVIWSRNLDFGIKSELGAEVLGGAVQSLDLLDFNGQTPTSRSIGLLQAHAALSVPIFMGAVVSAFGRGAVSFLGPLPPAEQIQLLQTASFMPLDPRAIQGDSGAVIRVELSRSFSFPMMDRILTLQPYGYATLGALYERETIFNFATHIIGAAAGGGVRTTLVAGGDAPKLEASLELYRQETNSFAPNYTALVMGLKSRF